MRPSHQLRTQALAPSFRCGPTEQLRRGSGSLPLIQVNPHTIEIIKIAPQSEAGARPLECLRFSAGAGVVVIRPLSPVAECEPKAKIVSSDSSLHFLSVKFGTDFHFESNALTHGVCQIPTR